MFSVKSLLLVASTVGALTVPNSPQDTQAVSRRYVTPSSQGTNGGYFYSMWSDGSGDIEYNNGDAGQYSLSWTNSGDVVVGKGWQTGADRSITYNADYQPDTATGYSFLSVYGWFKNPLVEYYICENWGQGDPRGGDGMIKKGSFTSDGSNYDVYVHQQVNAPSIQGNTNFMQYWSIRTDRRSSGTINTANHYNYWKSIGLQTGAFDYQILATEGVKGTGKSTVTISDGGSDAPASSPASSASPSTAAPPASSSVKPASSAAPIASSAPYSAVPVASSVASVPQSAAPQPSSSAPAASTVSVVPVASPVESSAASAAAPSDSTASYGDSPSSVQTPEASSATAGFGGYTPRPFGTPSLRHLTPGATPTPFGRHGHGHHSHTEHSHLSGSAYGSMPKATPLVSAAAAQSSDDCEDNKDHKQM